MILCLDKYYVAIGLVKGVSHFKLRRSNMNEEKSINNKQHKAYKYITTLSVSTKHK